MDRPLGAPRRSGYGYGRLAVVPEAPGMGYDQMLAGRTARVMGYTTSLYPCRGPTRANAHAGAPKTRRHTSFSSPPTHARHARPTRPNDPLLMYIHT